jgi:hypothetical protein
MRQEPVEYWPNDASRHAGGLPAPPSAPPSVGIALRQSLPGSDLAQVALEEIIEEGADRGDRREARHLIPSCGDRGFQDVGGELEGEPGDKPSGQAQPDVAHKPWKNAPTAPTTMRTSASQSIASTATLVARTSHSLTACAHNTRGSIGLTEAPKPPPLWARWAMPNLTPF